MSTTITTRDGFIYENLKSEVQNSMKILFPDYTKLWILRTECSKDALGAVLFHHQLETAQLQVHLCYIPSVGSKAWCSQERVFSCYFGFPT